MSKRVSHLCLRNGYMQQSNALAALGGREPEVRQLCTKVLSMLETEARCSRLDWERASAHVNIGNSYSREDNNYKEAEKAYQAAEQLAQDHLDSDVGNKLEAQGMLALALRAKAFALKKAGQEEEGKQVLRKALEYQMKYNVEKAAQQKEEKEREEAAMAAAAAEAGAPNGAAAGNGQKQ